MDLQSLASSIVGLLAVSSLVYFGFRHFEKKNEAKLSIARVLTSCYRLKPTSPTPGFFSVNFTVGLLASAYFDPSTGTGKVKKTSCKPILPTMSPFSDAIFQVTEKVGPVHGSHIFSMRMWVARSSIRSRRPNCQLTRFPEAN